RYRAAIIELSKFIEYILEVTCWNTRACILHRNSAQLTSCFRAYGNRAVVGSEFKSIIQQVRHDLLELARVGVYTRWCRIELQCKIFASILGNIAFGNRFELVLDIKFGRSIVMLARF